MRLYKYIDDTAPNRTILARLRKCELESEHLINCGRCKYHRGENRTSKSPHSDIDKIHIKWNRNKLSLKEDTVL